MYDRRDAVRACKAQNGTGHSKDQVAATARRQQRTAHLQESYSVSIKASQQWTQAYHTPKQTQESRRLVRRCSSILSPPSTRTNRLTSQLLIGWLPGNMAFCGRTLCSEKIRLHRQFTKNRKLTETYNVDEFRLDSIFRERDLQIVKIGALRAKAQMSRLINMSQNVTQTASS